MSDRSTRSEAPQKIFEPSARALEARLLDDFEMSAGLEVSQVSKSHPSSRVPEFPSSCHSA